jgi:hypothetical protein
MNFLKQIYVQDLKLYIDYVNELEDNVIIKNIFPLLRLFFCLAGGEIQWDYIHGLFDQAIYGGRVDNPIDTDVLRSYLMQYFNTAIISGSKGSRNRLSPNINIPSSSDLNVRHLKRKNNLYCLALLIRNIKRFVRI